MHIISNCSTDNLMFYCGFAVNHCGIKPISSGPFYFWMRGTGISLPLGNGPDKQFNSNGKYVFIQMSKDIVKGEQTRLHFVAMSVAM